MSKDIEYRKCSRLHLPDFWLLLFRDPLLHSLPSFKEQTWGLQVSTRVNLIGPLVKVPRMPEVWKDVVQCYKVDDC